MIHTVDAHVGKCIRHRRWVKDKTQQQLAQAVGIRFQQIQKYETGQNRVSASRLWDIARALNVPVSHFFEGLQPKVEEPPSPADSPRDITMEKETLDLLRFYHRLSEKQRLRLLDLARAMAQTA